MAYNYQGGNSGGFNFDSNPLNSTSQNNLAIINNNVITQGNSYIKIYTQTDCVLSMPYQSYSFEDYESDILIPGAYFNETYGRAFYGIGTTDNNLSSGVDYYNITNLPNPGGWTWTPITANSSANTFVNINGTLNITIPKNTYFILGITGPNAGAPAAYAKTGMLIVSGLPTATGLCVGADTKILMGDGSYKAIKDIKRNDVVIQDIETGSTSIVSKVYTTQFGGEMVKIPAGLIGNKEDMIISKLHPIWLNNNKRIYAKDLKGVEIIQGIAELYNLQFDDEGTFIADGVKIDSLSPYHKYYPLQKEFFFDVNKYIKGKKVKHENDKSRNKPLLAITK